jgi:hypothetical protein
MKRASLLFALALALCAQSLSAQSVYGEIPLEIVDGYLLAKTTMPDGSDACFAVDLAAQGTFVTKTFAGSNSIQKPQSSNDPLGRGPSHFALGGFGFRGDVLGKTTMHKLTVGGLTFADATVMVLGTAPKVGGRTIAGVLGLDLLRRAEIAVFRYGSSPALLLKSKANVAVKGSIEMPMKSVADVVVVEGTLNGAKADFLLDTGSPESYLPLKTVRLAGTAAIPNSTREITTLDGDKATVRGARVGSFTLGGESFSGLPFHIGELPLFGRLPESMTPVLLGNAFFGTLQFVEINFEQQTVRLKRQ